VYAAVEKRGAEAFAETPNVSFPFVRVVVPSPPARSECGADQRLGAERIKKPIAIHFTPGWEHVRRHRRRSSPDWSCGSARWLTPGSTSLCVGVYRGGFLGRWFRRCVIWDGRCRPPLIGLFLRSLWQLALVLSKCRKKNQTASDQALKKY